MAGALWQRPPNSDRWTALNHTAIRSACVLVLDHCSRPSALVACSASLLRNALGFGRRCVGDGEHANDQGDRAELMIAVLSWAERAPATAATPPLRSLLALASAATGRH